MWILKVDFQDIEMTVILPPFLSTNPILSITAGLSIQVIISEDGQLSHPLSSPIVSGKIMLMGTYITVTIKVVTTRYQLSHYKVNSISKNEQNTFESRSIENLGGCNSIKL